MDTARFYSFSRPCMYGLSDPLPNGLLTYITARTPGAYAQVHQDDPPLTLNPLTPTSKNFYPDPVYYAAVQARAALMTRQKLDAPPSTWVRIQVVPHHQAGGDWDE